MEIINDFEKLTDKEKYIILSNAKELISYMYNDKELNIPISTYYETTGRLEFLMHLVDNKILTI